MCGQIRAIYRHAETRFRYNPQAAMNMNLASGRRPVCRLPQAIPDDRISGAHDTYEVSAIGQTRPAIIEIKALKTSHSKGVV